MPKESELIVEKTPYQYKGKRLQISKCYNKPAFGSHTILTDDPFAYVEFYFSNKKKAMKYRDGSVSKAKYGKEQKFHYSFYWKQAKIFYNATKCLPLEATPLTAYYCMLNAVKAFLAYKSKYIEDFVKNFTQHGLGEERNMEEEKKLENICVRRQDKGIFVLFGKTLEPNFDEIWKSGDNNGISLKKLLYNLAFIHRAFITTYNQSRQNRMPELFLPVIAGQAPYYCKGNDNSLYLRVELDKNFFPASASTIWGRWQKCISDKFRIDEEENFHLLSVEGAKRNSNDSLNSKFKTFNDVLRKEFQYIRSDRRLWYLKSGSPTNHNIVNLNSMLITMAVMHRMSEIVRYKPEQMQHLLGSKESWLLHEFLTLALDQFIDELAAEITGEELMCTGIK